MDRSLRGMGIGLRSMESDDGVEFAERVHVVYDCPSGHSLVVPLSIEAEVPMVWNCRCGVEAYARDRGDAEPTEVRRPRSHWEMVLERRTIEELEALLAERLDLLRARRLQPVH